MAHFLVPPNGSGVGYDVDSKLAPGSVWRMQVPLGSAHDITLGGGAGLFVRSNNPGVVPNAFSESQNGDLRVFTLSGAALGTSMLEAGKGEQVWISLQVQVVSPAALLVQLIPRPNRGTLNPGQSPDAPAIRCATLNLQQDRSAAHQSPTEAEHDHRERGAVPRARDGSGGR